MTKKKKAKLIILKANKTETRINAIAKKIAKNVICFLSIQFHLI